MKKNILAILLAVCMLAMLLTACGGASAPAEEGSAVQSAPEAAASEAAPEAAAEPESAEETAAPEASVQEPEASAEEVASAEEAAEEPQEPVTCTATFSDGQTFEATVGEDFVFFFQCDAPGDMGAPEEGEEGAGITVSDGTVTYSNVGLGGPYQYPTSELVTISGFTGDFTITITEAATFMDATYTIYTEPEDIDAAIAFAEEMQKAMAENPMP